jgi:hypothetical protein
MSVTVISCNYVRAENLNQLIDVLSRQTLKPQIFVWDNSPTQDFNNSSVDWLIHSSNNAKCAPRWWMAAHATTEFVIIHDDDLIPKDKAVIARTVDAAIACNQFAVGAAGVLLERGKPYEECKHYGLQSRPVQQDTNVDIIKGRYFCSSTELIRELGHMELDAEDDIIASAILAKGVRAAHTIPISLMDSFIELPRGSYEREKRTDHRALRERTRLRYFG